MYQVLWTKTKIEILEKSNFLHSIHIQIQLIWWFGLFI